MAQQIVTNYRVGNLDAFKRNVNDTVAKTPRTTFKPILKFAKHGQWILGRDKDEVTLNAEVAVWAPSLLEGWIGWQNGKVVGEEMQAISGADIESIKRNPIDPVQKSDGWHKQVSFEGRFLKGDKTEFNYKASSGGGRDAFYELVYEIANQFDKSPDFINPIVQLGRDSYTHKEYGVIYKPAFFVVDWMSLTSTMLYSDTQLLEEGIDPQDLI